MNRLTLPLARRAALALAGVATTATLAPAAAQDALPAREIHLMVGFSPGSNTDLLARVLAERVDNPNADDPLFRPVDADDFRTHGALASDYSNLVENGLVRVSMPLPANVQLIDPATGTARADWARVSVIADSAGLADGLSTGLSLAPAAAIRAALPHLPGVEVRALDASGQEFRFT